MNLIELAGLDDAGFAERLSYELDDRTIAYALAVRAAFELAAAGSRSARWPAGPGLLGRA